MASDDDVKELGREAVARLRVYPETGSAEELAARLGLPPDEKWNKGEPRVDRDGQLHKATAVSYHSALARESAPDDRLADLVKRVEPLREALKAEKASGSVVRLSLAVFEDADNIMLTLPADLLAKLGLLGIDLELDIYDV
jgi:hypothetical protein